ncbi:apoptosis-enhancing nuclease [Poecilia latipinna]|uniref:Interferon stimulated exonuclease gene n=1 Tax=Poecilia latipinna TaxID=48699 RepID=A0A3B3TVC3_9TELE|nr:PREDICTED: apoptosis-enhancing nuclease-like [Poecilia latipinna]
MMSDPSKRNKVSHGFLGNYRYLCKKSMTIRAMESTVARKKHQDVNATSSRRRRRKKRPRSLSEPLEANALMKKAKLVEPNTDSTLNSAPEPDHRSVTAVLRDSWEVDSGFSESSPPASGRSSPFLGPSPPASSVVALDCEMVGTGPGGRCSALGRCSIVDYHGNVLYDKYVRPCQPVTDFRTPWSGIRRHHLHNAVPFAQAQEEILAILEGKVVVGHSIYNDFEVLNMDHPSHMVRDTSTTRHLQHLAGFPHGRRSSLKLLANKLLNRRIQAGRRGHCSVEDALAALDLYKLVQGAWEQEMERRLGDEPTVHPMDHYMQDEFWPDEVLTDGL